MEQSELHQQTRSSVQPVMPPQVQQSPVVTPNLKRSFDKRYIFLLLILIGIGGGFFTATRQPIQIPVPTPSDTPTPTPKSKPIVALATQSAYLDLTKSVASLSGVIQTLQVSDTTLSPPTIELPLGFPNE